MKDTQATGNYYNIAALTMITGLTDRTIRNYISSGLLQGEKINGLWHFTPEEVESFIADPAVYPSIRAKNHAMVYDFLADNHKLEHLSCLILDLPGADRKEAAEFFCYAINNGEYSNIQFSLDAVRSDPRIILRGATADVIALAQSYYNR